MTHPALPPPPEGIAEAELAELENTSNAAVGLGSSRVAGLTPEEEEGGRRSLNHRLRKAEADVRVVAYWVLAIIAGLLTLLAAAAGTWVVYDWLSEVVKNPARLDKFVTDVVKAALVALATMALQSLVKKKD